MEQAKAELDFLGIPLDIYPVTGTVLEASARTATHVTTARNAAGYVSSLQSHNESIQEFWIRTDSGQELPITIQAAPIPVRPGQIVEIFYAAGKGSEARSILGIKNITSGQRVMIMNRHQRLQVQPSFFSVSLIQRIGAGLVVFLTFLSALTLGPLFAIINIGNFPVNSIIIGVLAFVGFIWQHLKSNGRWTKFQVNLMRLMDKP